MAEQSFRGISFESRELLVQPVDRFAKTSHCPEDGMEEQEEEPVVGPETQSRYHDPKEAEDYSVSPDKRTDNNQWLGKAKRILAILHLVNRYAKNDKAE